MFNKNDIVKIVGQESSTIGRVVDSTDEAVQIFRDTGDIWYPYKDHTVVLLGVASL